MSLATLLCILCLTLSPVYCRYHLTPLSYIKLPYDVTTVDKYKLFGETAEESSYDPVNNMLYVVGEGSHLLHIIDISNPRSPQRLLSHQFYKGDGTPRDVEVCGTEVAVSLSSPVSTMEGHVQFFHVYTRSSTHFVFDGQVTVGVYPDMIKFTPDCRKLLVANEGLPSKDIFGNFHDPEGDIHIISRERTGNPTDKVVDFAAFNSRRDIRSVNFHIPQNILPGGRTLAQDLEPEYIAITSDSKNAYVTLQKNSAVAKVDIAAGEVTNIYPLQNKHWRTLGIDASDQDGGIHMRKYPIVGLVQPDTAKVVRVGRNDFLITANEGRESTYTAATHGFAWTDTALASNLARNNVDKTGIHNATFVTDLGTNSKLGRLHISRIDGLNPFNGLIEHIHTFGGRGFSVWNTRDMSLVYDSGSQIEDRTAEFLPNVFNSDCINSAQYSPQNLKDTVSDNMGPKINSLDVQEDNGTIYMILGSETIGALYVYTINVTSGIPLPTFQSTYRAGDTSFNWAELYQMNEAGNAGISDLRILSAEDSPNGHVLVYVVGAASGSVSIYQIDDREVGNGGLPPVG